MMSCLGKQNRHHVQSRLIRKMKIRPNGCDPRGEVERKNGDDELDGSI